MKEQFTAWNNEKKIYVSNSDGQIVFDSYDEVEKVVENSDVSSVLVYRREVSEWEVKGEIVKHV